MPPSESQNGYNVYLASETVESLDSFEGVPEPVRSRTSAPGARAWQGYLYHQLDQFTLLAPGVLLALVIAFVAGHLATWLGVQLLDFERSPVSPILVAVLLGLILRNTIGLPAGFHEGLTWCVKVLLRIGVALLGLRLSLLAIGQIGLQALPIVLGCISVGLVGALWLGNRLGISGKLSTLIAVGTSICGVSAIVATGPALRADDEEVSYAVASITIFGMLGLLCYPFLAHVLFQGDPHMAGFFLGTSIHDTSQVAGAALLYQTAYDAPETLEVATTTKLVRNVCMGAVIPLLVILHRRSLGSTQTVRGLPLRQWVPGFVWAFLGFAAFRSLGEIGPRAYGILDDKAWEQLLAFGQAVSLGCLSLALAAIGLGTSARHFRALGWKPLATGMLTALLVGCASWGLVRFLAAARNC